MGDPGGENLSPLEMARLVADLAERERGGLVQGTDPLGQDIGYTGRWHDAEAGLWQYRARAYSASMGRFLQRDPLGYGPGPNTYEYVRSSSVNLTDALGLEADGPPAAAKTAAEVWLMHWFVMRNRQNWAVCPWWRCYCHLAYMWTEEREREVDTHTTYSYHYLRDWEEAADSVLSWLEEGVLRSLKRKVGWINEVDVSRHVTYFIDKFEVRMYLCGPPGAPDCPPIQFEETLIETTGPFTRSEHIGSDTYRVRTRSFVDNNVEALDSEITLQAQGGALRVAQQISGDPDVENVQVPGMGSRPKK